MECCNRNYFFTSRLRFFLLLINLLAGLSLTACGGGNSDDDDSEDSADTAISISETFNIDARDSVLMQAHYESTTNGSAIGEIITAAPASAQPGNGYSASTIDIVNTANNTVIDTIDFATAGLGVDATAAQLAAFFESQNSQLDSTASTTIRLTLSTDAVTVGDQLSVNGASINGNTLSEVMADIDRLPNIVARIDGNSVISVTASDGNDLHVSLGNAAAGQTIGIESLRSDGSNLIILDSAIIGDGQAAAKATIGGIVELTLDYPLQLANSGSGNIFDSVLSHIYTSQNSFDANDPATYNDAAAINITDSLGNSHEMTQYFVRQDDMGGLYSNRWAMHVLIDGRNVGSPDTNGAPTLAGFDLVFDSSGQLNSTRTDPIEISQWVPVDNGGSPNGAATARIAINIAGSTQFGGPFTLTNVSVH
jgi:flagellar hook protein FlgE